MASAPTDEPLGVAPWRREAGTTTWVLLMLGGFASGALDGWLASGSYSALVVSFATGFSITACLLFGPIGLLSVLLTASAGTWVAMPDPAIELLTARALMMGVHAFTAHTLIVRLSTFPSRLNDPRQIAEFVVYIGPVAAAIAVGMSIGVSSLLEPGGTNAEPLLLQGGVLGEPLIVWVGLALGAIAVAPVLLIWGMRPVRAWEDRRALVTGVLVTTVAALTLTYSWLQSETQRETTSGLRNDAQAFTVNLQQTLAAPAEALESAEGLHLAIGSLTEAAFRSYARSHLKRNPGIQGLAWLPRLADADRPAFESRLRSRGFDIGIWQVGTGWQPVSAPRRPAYLAPEFVEPGGTNQRILGFDLLSDPIRSAAARAATDTGSARLSARLQLLPESDTSAAVVLLRPYFGAQTPANIEARRAQLLGFHAAAMRVGALVKATPGLPSGFSLRIRDINLDDQSNGLLYSNDAADQASVTWFWSVLVNGQAWQIEIAPPTAAFISARSKTSQQFLPVALLLGVLVAFLSLVISGHQHALAEQVQARTQELQREEDRRRQQEARLQSVLDNAPMAISLRDREGRFLLVNAEFNRRLGTDKVNLTGTPFTEILPPKVHARAQANELAVLTRGETRVEIYPMNIKGETRYYHIIKSPLYGPDGAIVGTGTFGTDVTDQTRLQHSLAKAQALLDSLVSNFPLAVIAHDLNGRVMFANPAWEKLEGVPATEILGRNTATVLPEARERIYLRQDERVKESGRAVTEEVTLDFDKVKRTIIYTAFPLRDGDQQLTGVGGIAYDVTDLRAAEAKLRQALKMEAIGQLTGGIAHDFNNLLAVIAGRSHMLELGAGDPVKHAERIKQAAARGSELTRRLLAFSRTQHLSPRPIELQTLVPDIVEMLSRTLGEVVRIEARGYRNAWPIMADPGQVESALLNLAINARDAMPEGGVLTIECFNVAAEALDPELELERGNYVAMAIGDTGAGIASEMLEQVFEPFFTTKDVGSGSGLGLSMVYGFTRQSGGTTALQSEPGQGTRVTLYLPRGEAVTRAPEAPARLIPLSGSREHILLIEDEPDVRETTRLMLEQLNYRVSVAADAHTAGAQLRHHRDIELVLSDVVLPGGTHGPEFVSRATASHPELSAVFMTGYAEADVLRREQRARWTVLQKPVDYHLLAEAVQLALGDKRQAAVS